MRRARSTRDGYGTALVQLGAEDPAIVVLDADLYHSTRTSLFAERFPERFLEMGIAEQDMVSTAVGLALGGMTPFANSFAVFITGRAFDQIRQQISLPALNVKIAGSSAGLTQGPDGATHQSVVDLAMMRCLPNMCVVVPSDAEEAVEATLAVARRMGPAYLRLSRYETPVWRHAGMRFEIGKAEVRRSGRDVTIASCGVLLGQVLEAADRLAEEGLSAEVLNVHTLKPIDTQGIVQSCMRTGCALTVEEHSVIGGLGSAVGEILAERADGRIPFHKQGVADAFGESGLADELLNKHGLTASHIVASAKKLIARKGSV